MRPHWDTIVVSAVVSAIMLGLVFAGAELLHRLMR